MQPNRSVRVPLMTREKVLELRDIRVAVEGLAAGKAARRASRPQVAELRRIALDIATARSRGDSVTDRMKVREFHFALYAMAGQPTLLRVIEGLWLQTGPYMNLLYPEYISLPRGPETRARIIRALQSHDAVAARQEIENDIRACAILRRRPGRRCREHRTGFTGARRQAAARLPKDDGIPRASSGLGYGEGHGSAAQQSTHRLVQRQVHAGKPGHDPLPRPQLEIRRRRLRHDAHLRGPAVPPEGAYRPLLPLAALPADRSRHRAEGDGGAQRGGRGAQRASPRPRSATGGSASG